MSIVKSSGAGESGSTPFYNDVVTTSLRLNQGSTLTRAYGSSPTSNTTMSFGGWVKLTRINYANVFSATLGGSGVPQSFFAINDDEKMLFQSWTGSANIFHYISTQVFRDHGAWYHFWFQIDTSDGTAADRVKIYVNGERMTAFDTAVHVAGQNDTIIGFNQNYTHYFGHTNGTYGVGAYFADWWFLDGQDVSPVDTVGEFKKGIFIPKQYSSPTFGNKGWHLEFKQTGSSADTSGIGADTRDSGTKNHWTISGIDSYDSALVDSPENNFCILNLAAKSAGLTLSEGNLQTNNANDFALGTFAVNSGKWYYENYINSTNGGFAGVFEADDGVYKTTIDDGGNNPDGYGYYNNGNKLRDNSYVSYGSSFQTAGDIIGVALDMDNGAIYFSKNGTWQGSATASEIAAGTTTNAAYTGLSGSMVARVGHYNNNNPTVVNFGQDPSFAGSITAGTATPSDGAGKFKYTPPTGFLALCSANLQEPTIGPNSNSNSTDHFETILYVGNSASDGSGTTQNITGLDFKPDWIWVKNRDTAADHRTVDSSRGEQKTLYISGYYSENEGNDGTTGITGFTAASSAGAGGFVLGSHTGFNKQNDDFVAYNWKANGSTTSTISVGDVSSGVPSIASTVQVNSTAKFSIVTFTGNNTNDATIGHGLGTAPEWIITKNRDDSQVGGVDVHWRVFHKNLSNVGTGQHTEFLSRGLYEVEPGGHSNGYIKTVAANTYSTHAANVDSNAVNGSGDDMIAYCFVGVEGFSKFGKYTGNGSTDGTFIYLGFRPAWLMYKRIDSTGNWLIDDNKTQTFNPDSNYLIADGTDQEGDTTTNTAGHVFDMYSNGFKMRNTNTGRNADGGTYIYMAFAHMPFKYANAR